MEKNMKNKWISILLCLAMVFTMTFASSVFAYADGETPISSVELTIAAPVVGADPAAEPTPVIDEEAGEEAGYTGSIEWANSEGVAIEEDAKFEASTAYTATVTLTAADGNAFVAAVEGENGQEGTKGTTVTVNGETVSEEGVTVNNEGTSTLTFEVTFPKTLAKEVTGITAELEEDTTFEIGATEADVKAKLTVKGKVDADSANDFEIAADSYAIVGFDSSTAGDKTFTVEAGGKTSASVSVKVNKKTLAEANFEISGATSVTYDGAAKAVTVTAKDGVTGIGTITVKYKKGEEAATTTAPTAPGTYAVTFDVAEGNNYKAAENLSAGTLTIGKGNLTAANFEISGATDVTWDGTAKAITVTAKNGVTGIGDITVKYKKGEEAATTTAPTAPGTYTVTFDVAEGDNYNAAANLSATTLKIEKATAPVATAINVSVKAAANAEKSVTLTGIPEDAENVTYAIEKTDNDNIIAGDLENVSDTDKPAVDENGVLTYKLAGTVAAENTATISVTVSSDNYADFTIDVVVTLVAEDADEATYNVTCDNIEVVYTGNAVIATGKVMAISDDTSTEVKGNWVLKDGETVKTPTNVDDSKDYTAVFTSTDEKYPDVTFETTISVNISKATITVAAKDRSIYVNDTVPDLTTPVKDTDYTVTGLVGSDELGGTVTMKYQKEGADATPDATEAGTYDIVISGATAPDGGNYNIVFTNGTLTISAKSVTPGGGSVIVTDPLPTAKNEATNAVQNYVKPADYEEAEAAEIKAIMDKAAEDIKNAKTAEEVKAIEAAAKEAIDKIDTAEEKAVIRTVEATKFRATSKRTTLNGKKAIKITWNKPEGVDFDGYDIYRSTKQFSGFGKTPFFTTTKQTYTNNKGLEVGKTYYYKVRAFKYVNGRKVYSEYSYKAIRTMK